MPGRGEGDGLPLAPGATTPIGGLAMYENDHEHETFTNEELLAEIGLDAYAIHVIRTEAQGEAEEFCSV